MNQAGELLREEALARLHRVRPTLAAFVAPAGYGKSTLVRQYLADDAPLVCDCAQASDELRIARAIVPELAAALEDGSRTAAERAEWASAMWSAASGRSAVFENLDALIGNDAALAAVTHFVQGRPPGARIVLVSRVPLPITLTRYAAPHEICVFRARDLAFSAADLAALLGLDQNHAAIAAGYAATRGWPIAALLLKRLGAEGRLGELLGRIDEVLADELREYLRDEIFAPLGGNVARGIAACVALPRAALSDLRLGFHDTAVAESLTAHAVDSPFVTRGADDVFTVHPIIAAYVREHIPEHGIPMQRELARAHAGASNFVRAAELFLASGDPFEAARTLAMHELLDDRTMPRGYLRVLSQFEPSLVQRHPRLWGISALVRMFRHDVRALMDESELMWHTLAPHASAAERYYVFVFRASLMLAVGRAREALACVDDFVADLDRGVDGDERLARRVLAQRGIVRARLGMLDAAQHDLYASLAYMDEQDVAASGAYVALGADIARKRGERALERQFLDRAIEHAERGRLENYIAHPVAEALVGAWLAGDDARVRTMLERLETAVVRFDVGGFRALVAAARGRAVEPGAADMPRFVFFARLISLEHLREDEERVRCARAALADAAAFGSPFLSALAHVALALCDEERRDEELTAAAEAAAGSESPALGESIAALRDGRREAGMLGEFVARIDRSRSLRPPALAIDVMQANVFVDGQAIRLSAREFELLAALTSRREGMTRARLGALLWPDVEDSDARNALSVLLHRLRAHLGRGDFIERDGDAYRIRRDAVVDLWEIERAATRARSRSVLGERERERLEQILRHVPAEEPELVEAWEWFAPQRRAIDEWRNALFVRLATDALASERSDEAIAYARAALENDPCDETACEVAIRGHLQQNERGEALRVFRAYREALLRELGAEPPPSLAKLVTT